MKHKTLKPKTLKFICFVSLLMGSIQVFAGYTGHVYIDKNHNGLFDSSDKALAGVCVSDGLHVVQTDKQGKFDLPGHDKERFVFITTPSGYYTYNQHYKKIDKKTSNGYDFGLYPIASGIAGDGSHKFVQISDTHIHNANDQDFWASSIHEYGQNEKIAFLMHTGDLYQKEGVKDHIKFMNTRAMGFPVYYCIGNHDYTQGAYGEQLYESIYGPVYYSFNVGNVHYLVLPLMYGDYTPSYKLDEVVRWMKNDLAHVKPGTPIVVFNHDLLTFDEHFVYGKGEQAIDLNKQNLKAWLYGHWHINYARKQGDVYTICSSMSDKGGIDHAMSSFRVVNVDGKGDIKMELRYPYIDNHLYISTPVSKAYAGQVPVTVNCYDSGTPISKVRYSLVDQQGKTIVASRALNQQSDWTWTGTFQLPSTYRFQHVNLQVEAICKNGEVIKKQKQITYVDQEAPQVKPGANWSNLLGNARHDGIVSSVSETQPTLAWTANVGANLFMSSPIVYNKKVYVASVDESLQGQCAVFALDAVTGKKLWRYQVGSSIRNTIVEESGLIFAHDVDGMLYAIDAESGKLVWQRQFEKTWLPNTCEGLVADQGIVYAGSGKNLRALKAETGEVIWQNKDWNTNESTVSTMTLADGVLIGAVNWSALYGNDIKTGKMLWSEGRYGLRYHDSSASSRGSLIYITSNDAFFIIEAKTGRIIVNKKLPYGVVVASTPLVLDKAVVFGTATNGLVALDSETLEQKWNVPMSESLLYTVPYFKKASCATDASPVLWGNTIYVTGADGRIYGICPETGRVDWKYISGVPFLSTPAISGNTMFVADYGGTVYAFTRE